VSSWTPSAPFVLYWQNELNTIQHTMTALEVFALLASLLNPAHKFVNFFGFDKEYATGNGWICEVFPNCKNHSNIKGLTAKESEQMNAALPPNPNIYDQIRYIAKNNLGKIICDSCREA
jgi:hypothetical protein